MHNYNNNNNTILMSHVNVTFLSTDDEEINHNYHEQALENHDSSNHELY